MRLFKETHIDFIKLRKIAFVVSGVLVTLSIVSLFIKGGPKLGLDFTGGVEIHLKFTRPPSISRIRTALSKIGLGEAVIQQYGQKKDNLILVRLGVEKTSSEFASEISPKVEQAIRGEFKDEENEFVILSSELIGPKVGKEIQQKAIIALSISFIGMLIYIALRFELRFAVGAIVALCHDVFIAVGALSIGNFEFNLPIVAALLTIIGYSLNDTIVIYDRIRENLKIYRKKAGSLKDILNSSINQSLSRTIITSLTTFVVVLALFLWGGEVLHGFAFALLIGVIVGTYSSSFVATPVVYGWERKTEVEKIQVMRKRTKIIKKPVVSAAKKDKPKSKVSRKRKSRKKKKR
ncbi:protein translocase subunit SecF [Candidatus Aerophobetes bacterium]|nr:protein translocase subunit SecF [Candidatus Aerophobetes bacterium]